MRISYNKLWKLLIDKDMKRKDLQEAPEISSASIAKLGKGENITTDVFAENMHSIGLYTRGYYGNDKRLREGMLWNCYILIFCRLAREKDRKR